MSVVVIKNPSSLKIKLDCGKDAQTQKTIVKSKTYGSVKHTSVNDDLYLIAEALVGLQKHNLIDVSRIDNTLLEQ